MLGPATRGSISTRQGNGIGYKDGYSSIGLFLTPNWNKWFQPFLDTRGHILNNGHFASNVGIGARLYTHVDWAFGANLYYDFRSEKSLAPHQLGAGLEALSKKIDVRFNGYFPVADTQRRGPARIDHVAGNEIIVSRRYSASYSAIQLEMGLPIRGFFEPVDLYLAFGPYYLFRKRVHEFNFGNSAGGELRANIRILDGLDIGGHFAYDRLFHGTYNGYVRLSFPFGPATMKYKKRRWKEKFTGHACLDLASTQRLLIQDVERHEIIPMKQKKRVSVGRDPATNRPIFVVVVDNAMPWSGKGTFESPYNSLSLAEKNSRSGQTIYLMASNEYLENISLKEGQSLHGSGVDLSIEDTVLKAKTEHLPRIVHANAITLGEQGNVRGVAIDGLDSWAIDATQTKDMNIEQVHFRGGQGGICADGSPRGRKHISDCVFSGDLNRSVGLSVQDLKKDEVTITNCEFTNLKTGIDFSGDAFFMIQNNTFANICNGITGKLTDAWTFCDIKYNQINAISRGITYNALSQKGIGQIFIEDNTIHVRDRFSECLLLSAGDEKQAGHMEAYVLKNHLQKGDSIIKVKHKDASLILRLESNFNDALYALVNYQNQVEAFKVDSLNLDASGVEGLNHTGQVLIPFEPVSFRPAAVSPRFFTPFTGFEENE